MALIWKRNFVPITVTLVWAKCAIGCLFTKPSKPLYFQPDRSTHFACPQKRSPGGDFFGFGAGSVLTQPAFPLDFISELQYCGLAAYCKYCATSSFATSISDWNCLVLSGLIYCSVLKLAADLLLRLVPVVFKRRIQIWSCLVIIYRQ